MSVTRVPGCPCCQSSSFSSSEDACVECVDTCAGLMPAILEIFMNGESVLCTWDGTDWIGSFEYYDTLGAVAATPDVVVSLSGGGSSSSSSGGECLLTVAFCEGSTTVSLDSLDPVSAIGTITLDDCLASEGVTFNPIDFTLADSGVPGGGPLVCCSSSSSGSSSSDYCPCDNTCDESVVFAEADITSGPTTKSFGSKPAGTYRLCYISGSMGYAKNCDACGGSDCLKWRVNSNGCDTGGPAVAGFTANYGGGSVLTSGNGGSYSTPAACEAGHAGESVLFGHSGGDISITFADSAYSDNEIGSDFEWCLQLCDSSSSSVSTSGSSAGSDSLISCGACTEGIPTTLNLHIDWRQLQSGTGCPMSADITLNYDPDYEDDCVGVTGTAFWVGQDSCMIWVLRCSGTIFDMWHTTDKCNTINVVSTNSVSCDPLEVTGDNAAGTPSWESEGCACVYEDDGGGIAYDWTVTN